MHKSGPPELRPHVDSEELIIGGRAAKMPVFFPSVSSVKTNFAPSEYVSLLGSLHEPRFLVSAYDLATHDRSERDAIDAAVSSASNCTILLDSGNYESFWHRDPTWTSDRYAEVLRQTRIPIAFSFDRPASSCDAAIIATDVVAAVERDQAHCSQTTICPIVHGSAPGTLLEAAPIVAARLQPMIIAVAERELGAGLVARAETVRRLARLLRDVAPRTRIHLLGTGNPTAILVYAMAGAHSFDGLEWCQTCVDPDTALLLHFQHRELVRSIDESLTEPLAYGAATLVHNLLFFRTWMGRIHEAIASGTTSDLLASVLPSARRADALAALRIPDES